MADVTYDSLINDQNFQRLATEFYRARDKDVFKPKSAKDIVDYFMKDRGWTDDNLTFGAIPEAASIRDMPPDQQRRLAELRKTYDKVPLAGFPGGRSFLPSLLEHTGNNLLDPTSYLGAGIGGFFGKKLASKAVGIGIGAGIDAAGSAALEGARESTEKDLGLRTDIDPATIATHGAVGGAASLGAQVAIPAAVKFARGLMGKAEEAVPTPGGGGMGPWGPRPEDIAPDIGVAGKGPKVDTKTKPIDGVAPDDVFAERRRLAGQDVDPILGKVRGITDPGADTFDLAASFYRQKYNDFQAQTRGVRPNDITNYAARTLKEADNFILRTTRIQPGTTKNAEEQGAIALMANDIKDNIINKLAYLDRTMSETNNIDVKVMNDLLKNFKLLGVTMEKIRGLKAETGRGLQYQKELNRIMQQDPLSKEAIDNAISSGNMANLLKAAQTQATGGTQSVGTAARNASGITDILPIDETLNALRRGTASEDFIRMLSQATDTEIALFAEKTLKPGWIDKAKEIMMFNMLSNPQTWVVNGLGTAGNVLAEQLLVRPLSVPIGMARKGLGNLFGKETGERATADEVAAGIKAIGSINGIWDALKIGGRAFWDEGYVSKYRKGELDYPPAIGGVAGKVTRFPMRVLNSTDALLGGLAERARLHSEAQKAWAFEMRDNPLIKQMNPQELNTHRRDFMDAFLANPPEAVRKIIEKEGRDSTFTNKLGPLMQSFSDIVNSNTIAGAIIKTQIPFIRTPFNVLNKSLDYVPLVPALKRMSGKYSAEEFDRMMARQVLGTIAFAWSVYNGFLGIQTGSGPADPKEREEWEAGNQNRKYTYYHDGVNGVNYNRMDPWAMTAGLGADVGYFLRRVAEGKIPDMTPEKIAKMNPGDIIKMAWTRDFLMGIKDVRSEDAWKAVSHSIAENITSKSFLDGIQNLAKLGSEQTFSQTMQNTIKNITIPRAAAALTRQIDPIVRQPEGVLQAITSDIPGLSGYIPPRTSALEFSRQNLGQDTSKLGPGIVRKYEGGTFLPWSPETDKNFPVSNLLSPYYRTTRRDDPLARDVARYYKELGELGRPEKFLNSSRVQLTPDQLNEFTSARNLSFRQIMDPFVKSPGWNDPNRGELANKMTKIPVMEEAAKMANKLAFQYVIRDRPELLREFALSKAITKLKFDDPAWTKMMLDKFGYQEMPDNIRRRW